MAEPPPSPGIHVVKVLEVKNYNFFRDSHEPVYITQYFFNCSSIKTVHYPNLLILFSIGYSQIQITDPNRPTSTRADSSVLKYKIHLSMLSPRGGGSRASHGVLTVRSVPRVGILIVQDIRTFTSLRVAAFILSANYVVPQVGNLPHFFRKCQNPYPMPVPPPPSRA